MPRILHIRHIALAVRCERATVNHCLRIYFADKTECIRELNENMVILLGPCSLNDTRFIDVMNNLPVIPRIGGIRHERILGNAESERTLKCRNRNTCGSIQHAGGDKIGSDAAAEHEHSDDAENQSFQALMRGRLRGRRCADRRIGRHRWRVFHRWMKEVDMSFRVYYTIFILFTQYRRSDLSPACIPQCRAFCAFSWQAPASPPLPRAPKRLSSPLL